MNDNVERVKNSFKDIGGFIEANNYKLINVEENYAEMEGKLDKNSMNPYNIPHGGYLFGLLDTCAGVAASTCGYIALTLDSNINYLKQCKSDTVRAVAKCIKDGKHIKVYDVNLYDGDIIICNGNVTYYVTEDKFS